MFICYVDLLNLKHSHKPNKKLTRGMRAKGISFITICLCFRPEPLHASIQIIKIKAVKQYEIPNKMKIDEDVRIVLV